MKSILLGRLSDPHTVFPYLYEPISQQLIILGMFIFLVLTATVVVFSITFFKKWTYLWQEWFTTVDHKKIGIMYIVVSLVMFLRGFIDAIMLRTQQALSAGEHFGYLIPEHFDQIFTAHGVIMIFFVAMPFMFGLMNYIIPLQIGARDVAFPYLNSLSFWLFVAGVILINLSLLIGDFSHAGWLAYPPYSELSHSPGVGVDYYIWALQISGVGSLLSGINFVVTILKMRCPGMSLMRMPIFSWTTLCSMILVIAAFPVLTATLGLLALDRYLDMHFFTVTGGGEQMLYVNLIWIWGHPEVYILILPAFGIFSEIVSTFSRKYLFGYVTMVWATVVITVLAFTVWLHHFFTMGAGANVNAFFGIMTMIIAVPTGVKVFNWIFTMFRGSIIVSLPMYWLLAFIITFTIGGMTGVLLSIPGIDFQMHNSVFLIAHFHNVIIGGVLFGYFAGLNYWFPKMFGFKLHDTIGKCAFFCWLIGFFVAFLPLYYLGIIGMTRRLYHYELVSGFQFWLIVSWCGALLIAAGVFFQILQIIMSIKNRHTLSVNGRGDAWGVGRTLEWSIPSVPPVYNFTHIPIVDCRDAFWNQKRIKKHQVSSGDICVPSNTSNPVFVAFFTCLLGFSLVWHIWWLSCFSLPCIISLLVSYLSSGDKHTYVSPDMDKTN